MKKTFSLEKKIYSHELLLEAIEDFKEVCTISLTDDYILEIEWKDEEEANMFFHEFMNYVISL